MAVKLSEPVRELHGSRARASGAVNIAIVAEGYTKVELQANPLLQADHFWNHAAEVVKVLRSTAPFSLFPAAYNVFGVPVISDQSATLIQQRCPAQPPAARKTAFEAFFCDNNSPRSINGNISAVRQAVQVDAGLPFVDHFLVVVNSALHGGRATADVGWFSKAGQWAHTAVHERGHAAFQLGDEYEDDELGDPPTPYTGTEPTSPNATIERNRAQIKWRSLIQGTTPIPSTIDGPTDPCRFNHPPAPNLALGTVGAFEGALHRACAVFRPAFACKMRNDPHPRFCAVCARHIFRGMTSAAIQESSPTTVSVAPMPGQPAPWTNLVAIPGASPPGIRLNILLYDSASGNYQMHDVRELFIKGNKQPSAGATIDGGLTWILPLVFGGQTEFVAYRFAPPSRFHFGVGPGPASLVLLRTDPLVLQAPTNVALAVRGNDQLALGYNRFTGITTLERLLPNGQPPVLIASEPWEPGWTLVAPLKGLAESLVLCYEWKSGLYAIRSLPSTFAVQRPPAIWSAPADPAVIEPQLTHAYCLSYGSWILVVGHSSISGFTAQYVLRKDGRGLDFIRRITFDTGAPTMPSLGLGLAALDTIDFPQPGSVGLPDAFLAHYSQAFGRITAYATRGR